MSLVVNHDQKARIESRLDFLINHDPENHLPTTSTLHLLCGMAGAGKTTLAKTLEDEFALVRLSPDEWIEPLLGSDQNRVEMDKLRSPVQELQWQLALRLLQLGCSVVWEQGVWQLTERNYYREQAQDMGARVVLHYLDISTATIKERLANRNKNLPKGSFRVDPEEIDTWMSWFEKPEQTELERYDEFHIYAD